MLVRVTEARVLRNSSPKVSVFFLKQDIGHLLGEVEEVIEQDSKESK